MARTRLHTQCLGFINGNAVSKITVKGTFDCRGGRGRHNRQNLLTGCFHYGSLHILPSRWVREIFDTVVFPTSS